MFEISRDTMISEILTNAPEAMPVFQNIGMHCLGCAMASGETLEQACLAHDVDPRRLPRAAAHLSGEPVRYRQGSKAGITPAFGVSMEKLYGPHSPVTAASDGRGLCAAVHLCCGYRHGSRIFAGLAAAKWALPKQRLRRTFTQDRSQMRASRPRLRPDRTLSLCAG